MKTRLLFIKNCRDCPHMKTVSTPGAGCATDWICQLEGRKIAGYIEWSSEEPKDGEFPKWCPLVEIDASKEGV